ncbi:cache domain-containing sensor histidine kinase [Ohessyouella blattaphilus]|uniref:Histidine kinase n=1 Tax=Ohessyouella blattaphilus TaxID=2949333 RepID=A0ABT1ELT1_9FIRM|nr:sensor histidine kinase [Ohessyouella blattaphilus]MCP1111439.1 histidine kinase [Ohessyouella blattaphilus]MCR8564833.1 histidine kinase [Ohessyouella blattaphilus]
MKYRKTFRARLLILFLGGTLIPLLLLTAVLMVYFNNRLENQSEQMVRNTLVSMQENISNYTEELREFSISLIGYTEVMDFYQYVSSEEYYTIPDDYEYFLKHYNYRKVIQKLLIFSDSNIMGVGFAPMNDIDNAYHMAYKNVNIDVSNTYAYRETPWFQKAIEANGNFIYISQNRGETISKESNEEITFSVIRLAKNISNQQPLGVIRVEASSPRLEEIFKEMDTGANSCLMLIDEHGETIYTTNSKFNQLATRISDNVEVIETEDDRLRVYTEEIPATGWQLAYLSSGRDIRQQSQPIFFLGVSLSILTIIISGIIYAINSYRITGPVNRMIERMKAAEKGDLTTLLQVPENANDEVAVISRNFNRMVQKLDTHINNEYRAVLSQKNAEYMALQMQINPHFLYNTLNGFITMNRMGEREKLEQSILHLTDLFRYTCRNQDACCLQDEIYFLEDYLALQKMRFEERMQYQIEFDDTFRNFIIPRLLIQPLVENAIIHGMEPNAKQTTIRIVIGASSRNGKAYLCIRVTDDGVGFDKERYQESKKVGVKNIEERLSYFYKDAFFEIDTQREHFTTSTIWICLEEEGGTHEDIVS